MKKIKILHLITHFGVGGAQENTLLTVHGHNRNRYIVHLAGGCEQDDWRIQARESADEFFVVPDLCRSLRPTADNRALNHITCLMKEHAYDIVHTHCAKAGILGRIAARRAKVPVIVHTYHSFGWKVASDIRKSIVRRLLSAIKKRFYVGVESYAASLSHALIAVCELNRREAISLNLSKPHKFTTIYSGIDLNRFKVYKDPRVVRQNLKILEEGPVVGTIGRLCMQKAPLDFIAAAKIVLEKIPETNFIMVGDGPMAVQVRQAIADETRIKLFGYRDDIPEILSVLDVFALSSLWEGLGRALTEAMIMGIPVAATAVDGVPELIKHFQTGVLSKPGNYRRLAENIIWLLNNPVEAHRMAINARSMVLPEFSAERMVERIESLYDQLLQERGYQFERQGDYRLSEYPLILS